MSLAECQRTGMTAAQYGNVTQCPAAQCAVLTGGNPLLEPEIADTVTVGFTLNPTALPDFTMSLDWYEIEVEDIIGNIPLNTIFNGCASGSNPEYCASVVRTPFGTLFGDTIAGGGYIVGTNANVAKATFQGVDAQGSYRFDIGSLGSLVASLNAVYIIDTNDPADRGRGRVRLRRPVRQPVRSRGPGLASFAALLLAVPGDFQASLQWRYIDSVIARAELARASAQGASPNGAPISWTSAASCRRAATSTSLAPGTSRTSTACVSASTTCWTRIRRWLTPRWSGPGTPNTWGPYDTLGRQVFFAVTGKF